MLDVSSVLIPSLNLTLSTTSFNNSNPLILETEMSCAIAFYVTSASVYSAGFYQTHRYKHGLGLLTSAAVYVPALLLKNHIPQNALNALTKNPFLDNVSVK